MCIRDRDLVSKKNKSLKNDLSSHVCHASPSSIPIACSTSSSIIENDICMLKKSVDCLGSTFEPICHEPHTVGIHVSQEICSSYACIQTTAYTCFSRSYTYAHMYTCTHCGRKGRLAKFCYDRLIFFQFSIQECLGFKCYSPHGPKKI